MTEKIALLNNALNGTGWKPAADPNAPVRALPGPFYTSQAMYDLERRAIFSRKWLLTTHKSRLVEPGQWIKYEVANYEFVICKDRTGTINAFHNVCRHRAYPFVSGDEGKSHVFSCKYHGWSYGLNGKLAKAPGYQDLPGFDKTQNNLFRIHVHVDKNGFIWVNLDAKEEPEIPWSQDFGGIDEQPRFALYNFDDYVFDHTWEMEGDYNWKILADNYNECYHCKTTHPDIPTISNVNSYQVECRGAAICHFGNPTQEQVDQGFMVSSTYHFPNCSFNLLPDYLFMQRFVPVSPSKSIMKYEVYRNKNGSDEAFKTIDALYKRIMSEDKALCAKAQKNINAGIFLNGELHPKMEAGPLYFQNLVRETLTDYHQKEVDAGREIWPAQQTLPKSASVANKDVSLCEAVDCCKVNKEQLAF